MTYPVQEIPTIVVAASGDGEGRCGSWVRVVKITSISPTEAQKDTPTVSIQRCPSGPKTFATSVVKNMRNAAADNAVKALRRVM